MSRPSHLLLIAWVYLCGILMARAVGAPMQIPSLWVGLAALLPVSASVHYANEYADYLTDRLTTRTLFSGGSGALPELGLPQRSALWAAWGALALAAPVVLFGWRHGMIPPAALALLGLGWLGGWSYSLPPLKLAWRGWGEVDNALLGGSVLPLFGYAMAAGGLDGWALLATLPFSGLVLASVIATSWPDREADAAAGKRTLATRLSPRALLAVHVGAGLAGYAALISLVLAGVVPSIVGWGGVVAAPASLWAGMVFPRRPWPFPAVLAMVLILAGQTVAWWMAFP
jgi:1,4-dihydroxy-2-naphthoate octaprenyltransferase